MRPKKLPFFRTKKLTLGKCSNFFVFKDFFITISVQSDLHVLLKRTNLASIKSRRVHGGYLTTRRMTKISGRSWSGKVINNLEMFDRQMTGVGEMGTSVWGTRLELIDSEFVSFREIWLLRSECSRHLSSSSFFFCELEVAALLIILSCYGVNSSGKRGKS